ncbi:MAG: peptidyl-tRNA hydrolase, partial [Bacteroidia bacterium]
MPNGVQAVQSTHAAINFIMQYPAESRQWFTESNYLCQLSAKDEWQLEEYAVKAENLGLKISRFYEPDLNNQLTAICIEPGEITKKLVRKLPLMFK